MRRARVSAYGRIFRRVILLPLALLFLFSPNAFCQTPVASLAKPQLERSYGKLPLSFEVNRGQSDHKVKFLSRGRRYALFLTGDEAVLSLRSQKSGARSQKNSRQLSVVSSQLHKTDVTSDGRDAPGPGRKANDEGEMTNDVLRMKLVGANPAAEVAGLDKLPGKSNYFIGNDPAKWRTNVPNYARVQYRDVYPGIDLVYYGNQGKLEYDFVVHPGADPKQIRLAVAPVSSPAAVASIYDRRNGEHSSPLQIDARGDIVIPTAAGEIRFAKPLVYQEESAVDSPQSTAAKGGEGSILPRATTGRPNQIEGKYVLTANNELRFKIGKYDPTKTLVIDPMLAYSTYLGGNGKDGAYGIAVDASGNAYVTGYTGSANFPTTSGALQTACRTCAWGDYDTFVTKLSADGSTSMYSTYLGGSSYDYGWGIGVDSSGNAYVTGYTISTDFPTTSGAVQTANAGRNDVFLAKLSADGASLMYSTYLGGRGDDYGYGIAVDVLGNSYVTGRTDSSDFPITSGAWQAGCQGCLNGASDSFVAKLSADGTSLAYSTYLGGSEDNEGDGIAVDSSGNAYVTGLTASTNFPTTAGALQMTNAGPDDAFVAKLSADGSSLIYSTYLGGTGNDLGVGIAVDSSGDAYVTGTTNSTDFPTSAGAFQSNLAAGVCYNVFTPYTCYDTFVARVGAHGSSLTYSTYLGGGGGRL